MLNLYNKSKVRRFYITIWLVLLNKSGFILEVRGNLGIKYLMNFRSQIEAVEEYSTHIFTWTIALGTLQSSFQFIIKHVR